MNEFFFVTGTVSATYARFVAGETFSNSSTATVEITDNDRKFASIANSIIDTCYSTLALSRISLKVVMY